MATAVEALKLSRAKDERFPTWLRIALSLAAFLALWELGVRLGGVNPLLLPPPSAVLSALAADAQAGRLWRHAQASALEAALGYSAAALLGIPFGLALGSYRRLEWALSPYLVALYSTPSQIWLPLLIMWMGIGLLPKVVLIFLFCFFVITLNTIHGVKIVDPVLLKVGRSFSASRWETFTKIIFPACIPFIVTGLRLAVGRAMIGVFLAEMVGADQGIGFYILRSGTQFEIDRVMGGVLILILTSIALTELVKIIEKRLTPWRQEAIL
jgi:NitT/TauT family transport system permease protein